MNYYFHNSHCTTIVCTLDKDYRETSRNNLPVIFIVSKTVVIKYGGLYDIERSPTFWLAFLYVTLRANKVFNKTQNIPISSVEYGCVINFKQLYF